MSKDTILITGSSGLVGSYFCRLVAGKKDLCVYTLVHSEPTNFGNSIQVDLSSPSSVPFFRHALNEINPDIIVHLAAMTDVDQCEIQRDMANNINHLSVKELSRHAINKDCFILYISTDYVFDGEKGLYQEHDNPNPINWYGMTKLFAEKELLRCESENWCIARTSTPFGAHTKKLTFPHFVINNLLQNREIRVLTDQITSPTYALNLAEMMLEIIYNRIKGIIHLCGSSQLSRFDQALMIASVHNLDKKLIKPASITEMPWKARRPRNSSLDVSKAYNSLANKPLAFRESLLKFATESK
jgi:dTDP-4-dehydrorhamnose reductase